MIDHLGEAKAEAWAQGVRHNLAREPKGGDTDQLKSGRRRRVRRHDLEPVLLRAAAALRQARRARRSARRSASCSPNQASWGTHVNISGAGVLKNAPHREAAIKFLEYLASDDAQRYFADGNNEWPVVTGVKVDNPVLKALRRVQAGPAERRGARQATSRTRRKSTTGWPGSSASTT